MSGRPVIVLAQTTPIKTQSRHTNVTGEHAQLFTKLGAAHVVIGAFCIIFQSVSIGVATSGLSFVGHGIWTGSLVRTSTFMKLQVSSFNGR